MLSTPHCLQAQPLGAICRRLSAASELNLCASVMLGSAFDADWMRVNAARAAATEPTTETTAGRRGMGDEGQPSAVAERGSFVVIGYLLSQLSRISAVWPAEIRAKAALCTGPG